MNRYTKSFGITTILYLLLMVTFLYSFDTDDNKKLHSQQTKSTQSVKFTIVQEQRVKKVKEEPKEKIKKAIVQKKIPKKIQTKKKKPMVKPIEKKIKKQTIIKQKQHKQAQIKKNQIKKNKAVETKKKNNIQEINKRKIEQQKYFTKIKELINQNKYYPRMAIKRGIEGMVKIKFTISKDGELLSFKIIEGKSIFRKSIQNAVQESFPLKPPRGLLLKNTTLSLKITYKLY